MKRRIWRDITYQESPLLARAIHRPGIELAEAVGRFETPFEYLKPAMGGFQDGVRFLLNKAIAAREFIANMVRHWRLDEPLASERDLEREWGVARQAERRLSYALTSLGLFV